MPGRLFAGPAALFTLFLAGSAVAADTTPKMMNIHGHVETLDKKYLFTASDLACLGKPVGAWQ